MKKTFRFRSIAAAVAVPLAATLIAACGGSASSSGSSTSAAQLLTDAPASSLSAPSVAGDSGSEGTAATPGSTDAASGSSDAASGSSASPSTISTAGVNLVTPGTLLVGTMSDSKPNAYLENGQWKGFDLDLVAAIAKDLGLKVEYRGMDFTALFPAVESHRLDIAAASSAGTIERQKIVGFSSGYLIGYLGVVTKKSSGITADAASTAGKRIGLLQGSIQEAYAKKYFPNATVVEFPDNNSGIASLGTGRVDGYFLDYVVGVQYLAQHSDLTQPLSLPAFDLPAAFPIAKDNQALKDAVNTALAKEVQNGTYLKLYKQYFPGIPVPNQLPPYKLPSA